MNGMMNGIMDGIPFNFFWIIPAAVVGLFFIRKFLIRRRLRGERETSLLRNENQPAFKKKSSAQIPEELKAAGRQVLDNLDWEIRMLEKQRLETTDSKVRKDIEKDLKRKKEEHSATVERFGP